MLIYAILINTHLKLEYMNVTICKTEEELLELKNAWNALTREIDMHSPFLSWEWIYTWWTNYKNKLPGGSNLLIFCIYDENSKLICIIPFYKTFLKKMHVIKLLGTEFESSDYLDIIISNKYETDFILKLFGQPQIIDELIKHDKLILNNILPSSILWKLQNIFAQKNRFPTFFKKTSTCPYLGLPESEEELLKGLSKNMKSSLRRTRNKINKDPDLVISKVEKETDIGDAIKALFDLHDQRFTDQAKDTKFVFEQRGAFHQKIAKIFLSLGQLAFYMAKFKDETIGCLYCYVFNNRVMYMQAGFNPDYARYALGNQLILRAITDGIENKNIEFDFMRGNEAYKAKWASDKRFLYQVEFGFSFKGKINTLLNRAIYNTKNIIKKILKKES
jgi:CelD/BcsL family acetyltransferase involved in cellulose biosynthesis